jgi:cytochrome c peroxidase
MRMTDLIARLISRQLALPIFGLSLVLTVAACSKSSERTAAPPPEPAPGRTAQAMAGPRQLRETRPARALSPVAVLGKQLFFDKHLSASGAVACATCHDPAHAYGPPNDLAVQIAGATGTSSGVRAVPTLRYKEFTPGYMDLLDNPDGVSPPGPGGGFTWDGRVDSLAEQARIPLLSPLEMANASPADTVARLRSSPSGAAFAQVYGAAVLADPELAFAKLLEALQSFQLEDPSFHPYTSKYDRHLSGAPGGELTPAEQRGLKVFADPKIGNCTGCHLAAASLDDGAPAQFTDLSFEAIGVPRNPQIPANRDHQYFDLGACGPLRDDHTRFTEFCGLFKTPTLRNAAGRRVFFHNGVIHSLEQAVRFYNTRDTHPEIWYPTVGGRARPRPDADFPRYGLITTQYVGGTVQKFDDLSPAQRKNVDKQLPLDGRAAGSQPPLTEQQVADVLCFLQTLNDDDQVSAEPPPTSCRD